MKIALAGATGLVGQIVARKLFTQTEHAVIALTRKPMATPVPHSNLMIDWEKWEPIDLGAEVFICCLGTTIRAAGSQTAFRRVDYDYVKLFAEAAQKSNAKKFIIITANGANANSSIFYSRTKGETEEMLKSFQFPAMALLRPSLLIGERSERRTFEKLAQNFLPCLDSLLHGPLEKFQTVPAEKVADAMIKLALQEWSGLKVIESDRIKSGRV